MANLFDTPPNNSGFTPADLRQLDTQAGILLRHIMRASPLTKAALEAILAEESGLDVGNIDAYLEDLIERGYVRRTQAPDQPPLYHIQLRRRGRKTTMQGIWHALESDSDDSPNAAEFRKTRSALTDRILPDLETQPAKPESSAIDHQMGKTLLSDLVSAGRTAMKLPPSETPMPEEAPTSLPPDSHSATADSSPSKTPNLLARLKKILLSDDK